MIIMLYNIVDCVETGARIMIVESVSALWQWGQDPVSGGYESDFVGVLGLKGRGEWGERRSNGLSASLL